MKTALAGAGCPLGLFVCPTKESSMVATIDNSKLGAAIALALNEGYRVREEGDGKYRVYLPQHKAIIRGIPFYAVDLFDADTPCTCAAGLNRRRCKHLSMAEALHILTHGR